MLQVERLIDNGKSQPKRVVLLRKHPTPTEEIYFLSPVRKLIDNADIDLDIIQGKAGLGTEKALIPRLRGAHVVVARYLPKGWLKLLRKIRGELAGLTYIVDDDIPAASETTNLPRDYQRRLIKVARHDFWPMLDLADTLLTTSTYLFERYASDKTLLLEPGLFLPLPETDDRHDKSLLRMAFLSTAMHQPDLEMIAPALHEIQKQYKHVQLEIIVSRKPPKALTSLPRATLYPSMSWQDYKDFVRQRKLDILLTPKQETPYNRAKSFIKVLDAAQLGAVGVYSDVRPYNEVVEHGKSGLLASNTSQDWYKALAWLIENPGKLSALRQGGRELASRIGNPDRLTNFWKILFCHGHREARAKIIETRR